jgi:hypothetical protein
MKNENNNSGNKTQTADRPISSKCIKLGTSLTSSDRIPGSSDTKVIRMDNKSYLYKSILNRKME